MTSYINGGVTSRSIQIPTKKMLKDLVKTGPSQVFFYPTSEIGQTWSGSLAELPKGVTLSVVGPDPYRSRKWYASITKTLAGNWKVT